MGLVSAINTNDKFLPSAPNTDFKDSMDAERYTSFLENVFDGIMDGITGITDMLKNILMAVFDKLKSFFGAITNLTKNTIFDMILDVLSSIMNIGGNLWDRLTLKNSMDSVCGHFDAGMFNKYGGNNLLLTVFTLMSLLTGLICMAVDGALTVISGILSTLGIAVDGVVKIVDGALDMLGLGRISAITSNITSGLFGSSDRNTITSGINLDGLLGEITGSDSLLSTFKNTPTASRLLSSFTSNNSLTSPINTNKFESYADSLLPNWNVKDFTNTGNAAKEMLKGSRNTIISDTSNLFSGIGNVGKKDFLKIF